MDQRIAEIMAVVDLESTIVFMVSDCGTPDRSKLVQHLAPPLDDPVRHKRRCYRHGIRVPALIVAPQLPRDVVHSGIVSVADVAPTILDLLGVSKPIEWTDGVSVLPDIAAGSSVSRLMAYAAIGDEKSAESATLKLHRLPDGSEVVYDKATDENEEIPILASAHPDPVAVAALSSFMGDPTAG
jgi:arylsulfatase A-like enzyme